LEQQGDATSFEDLKLPETLKYLKVEDLEQQGDATSFEDLKLPNKMKVIEEKYNKESNLSEINNKLSFPKSIQSLNLKEVVTDSPEKQKLPEEFQE
jgi:hypothetical protein